MATFQEALAEIYRNFSDEHLLEKLRSGTMIELAVKVAEDELESRGISYRSMPQQEEAYAAPIPYQALQFVTVASSLNSIALHILRARLEAEGIPAIVADANMAQSYSVAVGGARLQVPSEFYDAARQIIADVNSGALALNDDDDVRSQLA